MSNACKLARSVVQYIGKEADMARTIKDVKASKEQRTVADLRAIRGFDREAHFAAGGTLEAWRGIHQVQTDMKKERSRQACRRWRDEEG
jgi:hypothetical protein